MGAERPTTPGVSNLHCPDDECLTMNVTVDELDTCIRRLKRCNCPDNNTDTL